MKITTTTLLLTSTFTIPDPIPTTTIVITSTVTIPDSTPTQHLSANPAICVPMLNLRLYVNDLDTYPTQSGIYMAEAQALIVDEGLQCPTKNGILLNDGTPTSDACKKNQEIKDTLEALGYSSPEEKREWLNVLSTACVELDDMVGCPRK